MSEPQHAEDDDPQHVDDGLPGIFEADPFELAHELLNQASGGTDPSGGLRPLPILGS